MNPLPSPPTSLIGKCLRRSGPKQRGKILESYAAEVVIACRIMGPRAAGESLGQELFGKKGAMTATPILKVVAMVESGEIPVTREQLLAVVEQDESAMRYYALNPWIIDPTGQSAPPTKKGRKPKNLTEPEPDVPPQAPAPTPKKRVPRPKPPPAAENNPEAGPAEIPNPPLTKEVLLELTRQEEENQRRPAQEKKTEPTPPVFRGTPAPPLKASNEELEEWRRLRKQEVAAFVETARSQGWEIPADWDGLKSVAKIAKWIGPPPA